jgi:hypothetical protein
MGKIACEDIRLRAQSDQEFKMLCELLEFLLRKAIS